MADWLKDFQSKGRGIRNGEMTVVTAGYQSGKTLIVDMKTQGVEPTFKPSDMRHFNFQYWCHNAKTDKWTYHSKRPFYEYIDSSDRILARREDGSFYWYKDRERQASKDLTDEEVKDLTFAFIQAEEVKRPSGVWVDMNQFRAKSNPCNEIIIK